MTQTIVETAPAKINLALHVRARRADGYHELETLFAFLQDGDELRFTPGRSTFEVEGPFAAALSGEGDNLVLRAARGFAGAFGVPAEGAWVLEKNLPVASGIGGGSADAAAALRLLARVHGVARDDPRLFAVADALGSDVPACLLGRPALGTGRGEKLEPLEDLGAVPVLLVNPGIAVSTGPVFRAWDGVDRGAIPAGGTIARARAGRNDLEAPARAIAPGIGDVIDLLATTGPMLARMSGSGATCFALYEAEQTRAAAAATVRAAQPGWWCLESRLS
ncbi:4-(cytidine 5'-diphospho)-2-C-methyl-D-erythritol kinase [Sphingomonas sp. NFR15]|uniref:4-(cytidine 5'-diphospho)-2-C-methyl-D-erythritol kinase n=1 Tax=Sphingomonas sp. NFR15 TaxID=1566282 RepID=UPI000885D08D|nr:4-(cytidine 5'-diphospho)-2-C-methyl-D-erythritol kinase [Sphingomonas sp. NFR15]SDA28712.1 4-diphosphocytidyl-2-C-methyl-D-erythritol kinase [Sphingomonas sp. NFR15]